MQPYHMDEVYEYDKIDMDKFICKDEIDDVEWYAIMNEIEWQKWPYGSTSHMYEIDEMGDTIDNHEFATHGWSWWHIWH